MVDLNPWVLAICSKPLCYADHRQKDSGNESAPSVHRAVTTPSPRLRSVYLSNFSKATTQRTRQQPPRRRLISSETIHEEVVPFTPAQVGAAESHTTPKTHDQAVISELPESPVRKAHPPRKATSIESRATSFQTRDNFFQATRILQHESTQTAPDCKDQAAQVVPSYQNSSTQATVDYRHQSTQFIVEYRSDGIQVALDCRDKSTQFIVEHRSQGAQVAPDCRDQAVQVASTPTYQNHAIQTETVISERSEEQGERISLDQALQTEDEVHAAGAPSAQSEIKLPGRFIGDVEPEEDQEQSVDTHHIATEAQSEILSPSDLAFYNARRCSRLCSQFSKLHQNIPSPLSGAPAPDRILLSVPEDTHFRMFRIPRGEKVVLNPSAHSRAVSSESSAKGVVYVPGWQGEEEPIAKQQDEEPKPKSAEQRSSCTSGSSCSSDSARSAAQRNRASSPQIVVPQVSDTAEVSQPEPAKQRSSSNSCSSCCSESSCSSVERNTTLPPRIIVSQASDTAEGFHYTDAKQHLSLQSQGSVEDSDSQQRLLTNSEISEAHQPVSLTASSAGLCDPSESSVQAARRFRSNGKRRASSVSYWFESEEEDPKEASANSLARTQTLARFRSVPLIRLQRPSTDSERMFGLGSRAMKPSKSADPVVSIPVEPFPITVAATPASPAPVGHIAFPDVSLPVTKAAGKKHLRDRLKGRRGKQFLPVDPSVSENLGIRGLVKRKGGNIGRKGRQKVVFRKKVLRILLGKELADTVQQALQTKANATGLATVAAELVHGLNPIEASVTYHAADPVHNVTPAGVAPLPTPAVPASSIPVSPTNVDGPSCEEAVEPSLHVSIDLSNDEIAAGLPQVDGSHEESKAKHQERKKYKLQEKEDKRRAEYEEVETDIEVLLSIPRKKCEGHKPDVLELVYEAKGKMLKYETPDGSRKERKIASKAFIEKLKCKCLPTKGEGIAGPSEAASKAKKPWEPGPVLWVP